MRYLKALSFFKSNELFEQQKAFCVPGLRIKPVVMGYALMTGVLYFVSTPKSG
jgi:hypothetical protein